MSMPSREAEWMDVAENFWNGESYKTREGILAGIGFPLSIVERASRLEFRKLSRQIRSDIVQTIGEALAK